MAEIKITVIGGVRNETYSIYFTLKHYKKRYRIKNTLAINNRENKKITTTEAVV